MVMDDFAPAQVVPQAGIRLVAIDEHLDGVTRSELGIREQLDDFGKVRVAHRRTTTVVALGTDLLDGRSAHDIEHADEEKHGDRDAEQYERDVAENVHSAAGVGRSQPNARLMLAAFTAFRA